MENVDFHDFLDRMRNSAASDLVRSIKSFIIDLSSKPPDPENDSKSVQEFMSNMELTFKDHPLWVGATNEELESSGEGLEKYLMTKLFNRSFAPLPEEAEHDQKLFEKLSLLQQFVRPEHLDIPSKYQNESSWILAQKELQKINTYKAPRDKLVSILNCSRVILNVSMATNESPPGADEFLPVLIYVTLKANPPQLYSNLLYIQRYRHHTRLVSEASYFFTNLVSAESFLFNVDGSSLSMDAKDFEKNMRVAKEHLDGLGSHPQVAELTSMEPTISQHTKTSEFQGVPAKTSGGVHSDVINVSLPKLQASGIPSVLEANRTGHLAREFPFLYANVGDLRVEDVDSLLTDYKELVLKYYSLCKAVEKMSLMKQVSSDFNSAGIDGQIAAEEEKQGSKGTIPKEVMTSRSGEGVSKMEQSSIEEIPAQKSEEEIPAKIPLEESLSSMSPENTSSSETAEANKVCNSDNDAQLKDNDGQLDPLPIGSGDFANDKGFGAQDLETSAKECMVGETMKEINRTSEELQ